MDRRAWRATVYGVAKSRTQLSTTTIRLCTPETHTVSSLESALALCLPLEMAPVGKLFSMIGFDSGGVEGRRKPSSWFRSMEGR